jgi:Flp pilus assembly protein TadG
MRLRTVTTVARRSRRSRRYGRRGQSLVLTAIYLVVLMGMAALAIDLGMLFKVRAEAQRAADAAAMAGASAFLTDLSARAQQVAGANTMAGTVIDPLSEMTLTVRPDSFKVRVHVGRAAVPTWFARIFNHAAFAVGARSAAQVSGAGAAKCLQPIVIPDFWNETASDPNNNRWPDGGENWQWNPSGGGGDTYAPAGFDGSGTGLGSDWRNAAIVGGRLYYRDVGRPFRIWEGLFTTGGFRSEWCLDGTQCGPSRITDWIVACEPGLAPTQLGVTYTNLPAGATGDEVDNGYAARLGVTDPTGATWVEDTRLVNGTSYTSGHVQTLPGTDWRTSPRVILVPLANPEWVKNGRPDVQFNNFGWFWVESYATRDLVVRFIGPASGGLGGGNPGTLLRVLRLVE